jgi:hypothetical protein
VAPGGSGTAELRQVVKAATTLPVPGSSCPVSGTRRAPLQSPARGDGAVSTCSTTASSAFSLRVVHVNVAEAICEVIGEGALQHGTDEKELINEQQSI